MAGRWDDGTMRAMRGTLSVPFMLLLLAQVLWLASCADSAPRNKTGQMAPDMAAERIIVELQDRMAKAKALPPDRRYADLQGLEASLLAWAAEAEGTKAANHVWYHLAWWRYEFAAQQGTGPVLDALDRLDAQPSLHLKQAGTMVRVRALGRRGELSLMADTATLLQQRVPELGELALRWVAFHRLVGATAPISAARNLNGGPDDPLTREAAWQAWQFVGTYDDETAALCARFLAGCPATVQPVVVCADASPLIVGLFQRLPGAARADLLWLPADTVPAWANAWRLPGEPVTVLIGRGRRLMAMDLPVELIASAVEGKLIR